MRDHVISTVRDHVISACTRMYEDESLVLEIQHAFRDNHEEAI